MKVIANVALVLIWRSGDLRVTCRSCELPNLFSSMSVQSQGDLVAFGQTLTGSFARAAVGDGRDMLDLGSPRAWQVVACERAVLCPQRCRHTEPGAQFGISRGKHKCRG